MKTYRVLVVDDEPGLRMTLAANLELEGYEVTEAPSGEAALALTSEQSFDLVMTDIRMPGITGVELFQRLHAKYPEMPVVLMTGFALEELVQSALDQGAFTVLPKPFDVDHALKVVATAVLRPAVLVVDDMVQVAQSTADALSGEGVHAEAVFTGIEAARRVSVGGVDVCVVDLVMPDQSGPEVIQHLLGLNPALRVITMSGNDVPDMLRQAASSGMQTFLRKPFRIPDLIRAIAVARGAA